MAICLNAWHFDKRLDEVCCLGGDAEVNGTLVGSLMGAKYGLGIFKENWIDMVLQQDEDAIVEARIVNFM
jgi:ADP-ribosylglycohydrolase